MRVLPAVPTRHAIAWQPRFATAPIAYSNNNDGDVSKCEDRLFFRPATLKPVLMRSNLCVMPGPFFGGPNGGGIGDANIVTGALFVAVVCVLRLLILKLAAMQPQRMLVALLLRLPRTLSPLSA